MTEVPDTTRPLDALHPAQRRWLAEDLLLQRRAADGRRIAAPQRAGRVDANPHQIEAVVFALARHEEGGCILADEVGLGKTIEAGLVIRQLLAEGARRVLLVAPKPLLGQWRQELFQLFGLDSRVVGGAPGDLDGEGIFLIGREAAGGERGNAVMRAAERFDLCVVDEAHEIFAGIHRRFDARGEYDPTSEDARTAGRLHEALVAQQTPVILLTATPIQNTLAELWSLVRFVDPFGTLLGDLPTFRSLFCQDGDRLIRPGTEEELRRRLEVVMKRTLRRQAQEFLDKKFVDRTTKLFEYDMGAEERALYDDITSYLLAPDTVAFSGHHGQLILLGYLRRLGSSRRAIQASLERLVQRLDRVARASSHEADERDEIADLRDATADDGEDHDEAGGVDAPSARAVEKAPGERQRVLRFIARARALPEDPKAAALRRAVGLALERAGAGDGSGKVVIFTEFVATQEYIRDVLVASGLLEDGEITLFRGDNDTARGREALARWERDVPRGAAKPSRDIALRMALVHEFKTARRGAFISTEAGAKGLNLQFAETLINYDLPWNPQRIEQRIGRCHRYGQTREVVVVNFLARDNEAERLTFDILSRKLELFGTVLSASDDVLHRASEGATSIAGGISLDFEAAIRQVYKRARTLDEVTAGFTALHEQSEVARRACEETHAHTADVIRRRFDDEVREVFRARKAVLPGALAALDKALDRLVCAHLEATGVGFERAESAEGVALDVMPSPSLPEQQRGGAALVAGRAEGRESLHLSHPLVLVALAAALEATGPFFVTASAAGAGCPPGARARLVVEKLCFAGFERTERLVAVALTDRGEALDADRLLTSARLANAPRAVAAIDNIVDDAAILEAIEDRVLDVELEVDAQEHERFSRAYAQLERYVEDRLLIKRMTRRELDDKHAAAVARRDAATGSAQRQRAEADMLDLATQIEVVDAAIAALESRDEATYAAGRDRLRGRRGAPPVRSRLLDMEIAFE